ncbi:acyl-[ACP]--phospholipid O-acyltransferase [Telmatospirillum sp. J64-1]|uniref:acyl-[ACP]--phospholipid O-acyltransferase n=1 Tax=Telmatospirillum sp. J64-1 TaxID=2502183 RepID=UPI00163D9458|nr:acyl-[ACP]--phospholipid O-acyltransferase [Telmatospirillum sp. J64-1]
MASSFSLLAKRRFLPLFVAQFLGAMNDNFFKNALVILVLFGLGDQAGLSAPILVTAAAGLFILPFFLFSATAGQLADRMQKTKLVKLVKLAEIGIAVVAAWGLLAADIWIMLAALFLLGVQSAFFGPLKYSILPEQLREDELISGNALVESGTFLAILIGTIGGGILVMLDSGPQIVSAILLVMAVAGFAASLFLPAGPPGNPQLVVHANILRETGRVIGLVRKRRDLFLSVLGISWFWLMGATFLSQFPAFARDILRADQYAVTVMLTVFSVGIGLGSMLCGRVLKGEISARFVPFAAIGITLFSLDLYLGGVSAAGGEGELAGLGQFLSSWANLRVLADLLLIAVCGGLYIVPLYAILQSHAEQDERARVIAANNIVNAAFMVVSALVTMALLGMGWQVTDIFLLVAAANAVVAVYICGLLPDAVIKGVLSWLLRRLYKVELSGFEHLKNAGERVVIAVNHVSLLDAVLMATFLPQKPTFAINSFVARRWWVKPFLTLVDAFPLDPTNPLSTKALIRAVQAGRTVVIFPEGRITVTGALMKVYEGPGMIADRAGATLVPVRIDGAQYTPFSYLKGKVRRRLFPRIRIFMQPPQRFDLPPELKGRARRQRIGQALYDVMSRMMYETAPKDRTLFEALLDARAIHGGKAVILDDINRKPVSYGRVIIGSLALGRKLIRQTRPGETVGLLLPNATATALSFCGLQAFGRVAAMLNFTAGPANILSACEAARIGTVVTSRRFIEQARLQSLAEALDKQVRIVWLEDIRDEIGLFSRLRAFAEAPFAGYIHRRFGRKAGDAAAVLFTSGSEGKPKGVVLSHANILANCQQLAARVDFSPSDLVFNALPVFHSFGLTGGLLLPLLSGVRSFLYPSPLHYRIVPEMVYDTNATIMFGTDTFLSGYARVANPYDFYSLRYIFAGAEKVRDETRKAWMEKFGLRILEGYGATETAPVIAVNTPMHYKAGSVGRLLPAIECRLEKVPGIEEGGRLHVRGPNVMLGYLRAERPGELEPPAEGWYDTGDIVAIDDQGFLRILGRAKRFAKVAGEMVSLTRVEAELALLWPDAQHAVIALPDPRKGEQLVLLTTHAQASRAEIQNHFRKAGLAELWVPRQVQVIDRMPVLGTGKTDYVAAKAMVETTRPDTEESHAEEEDAPGGLQP